MKACRDTEPAFVREALTLRNRVYVLVDGRVLAEGTAKELAENPEARRQFLGEAFRLS